MYKMFEQFCIYFISNCSLSNLKLKNISEKGKYNFRRSSIATPSVPNTSGIQEIRSIPQGEQVLWRNVVNIFNLSNGMYT